MIFKNTQTIALCVVQNRESEGFFFVFFKKSKSFCVLGFITHRVKQSIINSIDKFGVYS